MTEQILFRETRRTWNRETILLIIGIILLIVIRIVSAWFVPDLFDDEWSVLRHVEALNITGKDFFGNNPDFYLRVGRGLTTYAFIYPLMYFCKIIGSDEVNVRILLQVLTIISCFASSYGLMLWTNKKTTFWMALYMSLMLPWGFVQANRIWDPAFVPVYFSLFFLFFSLLMQTNDLSRRLVYLYTVLSMCALVLLAVVYPPCRIPAVAIWIVCMIWIYRKGLMTWPLFVLVVVCCALIALPMAYNMFFVPKFNYRAQKLFIYDGEHSIIKVIFIYVKNFFDYFEPKTLFVTGDRIYRHSLPVFGLLGSVSIVPVICLIRKKNVIIEKFLFFIIVSTFASAALTREYHPHSLRSCLCWMVSAMLIALGWETFFEEKSKRFKIVWFGLIAIQFALELFAYYTIGIGLFPESFLQELEY